MTHLEELWKEQEKKQQSNSNPSKTKFSTRVVYLGAPARPHFPKKRDENGKKIVDPQTGRDMVSDKSDGDTYTFSEMGSSRIVKIVWMHGIEFDFGKGYDIEGLGYDMKSSNMLFLDENCLIEEAVLAGVTEV